ncbi:MAG TPA: hypothetical protein VHX88_10160 [Solirubrobacteraceae bacterium]|nr:hypothetical protein [Solirubrobacteraceae bacterium]
MAEELTRWAGVREPCHVLWTGHAVSAHLAAGREQDARRVADWVQECSSRLICHWPRISTTVARAQLADHDGDDVQAARHFERALALHAEVDLPLQRIEALIAYGRFLRRRGRPDEARPALAAAAGLAQAASEGIA